MIKTLIVDDSPIICRVLSSLLSTDNRFIVSGTAYNGQEAIDKNDELSPDLIIMDINMPVLNGLEATSIISKKSNPAIVAFTTEDAVDVGFKCIEAGALELIQKPELSKRGDEFYKNFLDRLYTLAERHSKIKELKEHKIEPKCASSLNKRNNTEIDDKPILKKLSETSIKDKSAEIKSYKTNGKYKAILIGASTGGPSAIQKILKELSTDIGIPIFITQHIDEFYDTQFMKWLGSTTSHQVVGATHGDIAEPGKVYVAPADFHLCLNKAPNGDGILMELNKNEPIHFLRPSVDAMFKSAAENLGSNLLAVILTGMGRDGADGILEIHKKGGLTIAQDEESCIVYGMPKAAVENGSIKEILSLSEIPSFINKTVL